MIALAVSALATRMALPTWVVKVLAAVAAFALVVIVAKIGFTELRTYAQNETQVAVTQASDAAKAEVAAKVNAASEAQVRAAANAEAASMKVLEASQAAQAAMWTNLDQTIATIEEPDHDMPVPALHDAALLPSSAAPAVQPVPAKASCPSPVRQRVPAFGRFIGADRTADRLLERATGTH